MQEIIKILIKNLIYILKFLTSKTSESKIIAIRKNKEDYQSYSSDSAYVLSNNNNDSYLAIRILFETKCRFSVLFPKVLSSFEAEYFSKQSWANYFPDDRFVDEKKAENGYFLPWTNQAYGTKDLFAKIWKLIKVLPAEVKEIHSDGKYLRVIFHGKTQILASIDKSKVKSNLSNLVESIKKLPVQDIKRVKLADAFPLTNWIYQISAVLFCYFCFMYVTPSIDYIDSKEANKIMIYSVISCFLILFFLIRKKGLKYAFRISALATVFASFVILSLYMRLNNEFIKDYTIESWRVTGIYERRAKYTKELTGYNFSLTNAEGQRNLIGLTAKKLKNITVDKGSFIKLRIKTDVLGFKFIDSAKYAIYGNETELLN